MGTLSDRTARQLREEAVASGFISKEWAYMATPHVIPRSVFDRLVADLASLEELIFSLPNRAFQGSLSAMACALGYDARIADLMDEIPLKDSPFPLRWDMIHDQCWRLLEINTGYCMGGFNVGGLPDAHRAAGERWAFLDTDRLLARHIPPGDVQIVEMDELVEDYGFFADGLTRNISPHRKGSVSWYSLSQVDGSAGVLPMMTYQELADAGKSLPGKSFLHPAETLFADKEILAWLHEPSFQEYFSPLEKALVNQLVPLTYRLRDATPPADGNWVLKPCGSYGGKGVKCQWTSPTWNADLEAAAADQKQRYILQLAARASAGDFVTVGPDDRVHRGRGEPVLGLITIGRQPVGGLSRVIVSDERPGITNAHCGAAMGLVAVDEEA